MFYFPFQVTPTTAVASTAAKTSEMAATVESQKVSPTNATELFTPESPKSSAIESGCVFPFTYKGVIYNKCTKVNHHRLWCSKDAAYKGKWKNCNSM